VWPYEGGGCPSIFDIGTGLSRTPRFAGQTKIWYPVLAHVMTVADLLPDHLKIYGLLHDAGEAVVGDQVSTWKNDATSRDEDVILFRVSQMLGIEYPWGDEIWRQVKIADRMALRAEASILGHAEPNHPSFLACEKSSIAEQRTAERCLTRANQWTEYGYGGDLYERAVNFALTFSDRKGGQSPVAIPPVA